MSEHGEKCLSLFLKGQLQMSCFVQTNIPHPKDIQFTLMRPKKSEIFTFKSLKAEKCIRAFLFVSKIVADSFSVDGLMD